MILAQDEMTIQRMLGCNEVPADVHDEYLKRVRFLHRETAGGPMGPGMVVDMLRFLGFEPAISGSDNPDMVDWRQVERGTRVKVRRAGRWTASDVVCRFEGFVDMGTLAVELPGGRVDEFNKCDVKILAINPEIAGLEQESAKSGTMLDGKAEPDARLQLQKEDSSDESEDDTVSAAFDPELDSESSELSADDPALQPPSSPWPPAPDWKTLKEFTPVWVREKVGEGADAEFDLHDGKFVSRLPGGRIKVKLVVGDGEDVEEIEKVFPQDDVRLPA